MSCKSIIVHFSTIQHRTMMYRSKQNTKNTVRVKLDLTKKHHNIQVSANKVVSNTESVI